MSPARKRRRRFAFQRLEDRRLLAAQISELLVAPLFGDNDTDQMVELRGEPNETLDDGTYLVVVTERGLDPGEITGIFDLGGQQFGSNGYLVLLQQDSPHVPALGSTVLQSTEEAFGGLPGDIYTDTSSLSDRIDFIIGANAYMLIQTDVPPVLEQTIDANEDGLIDPVILQSWDILDSISLHPFVGRGDVAYGNIVFAAIGTGPREITVADGVPVLFTEGFGYAGRIGESTGSSPADWVASTVVNESGFGDPDNWALADNLFGEPSPYAFAGRDLDHVGGPNFVGGVRGIVRSNETGNPISGISILADTNNNGVRDNLTFVVDPDDVVGDSDPEDQDYPLINAYPGVTVTNFSLDAFPSSDVTSEFERDFPATLENRIFSKGAISWFSTSNVLRFDFYRPINSASIVALSADSSLSKVFGRIDAFNADGQLIDTDVSSLLSEDEAETIEVSSLQDDIAYLFVYSDDEHEAGGVQGSPFGRFDRLTYSQREPLAVSGVDGSYEIQRLFPLRLQPAPVTGQQYNLQPIGGNMIAPSRPIEITRYENFVIDFELFNNDAPILQSAGFELAENATVGTVVGQVVGTDPNGQSVTYRIDEPAQGFVINAQTGLISVGPDANLDFETNNRYSLTVLGQDPLSAIGQATVVIELIDVNEAPMLSPLTLSTSENTEVNETVGSILAENPEPGQTIAYEVVGGTGENYFAVDSQTGSIILLQSLDFELLGDTLTLDVRATDNGNPPLSSTATVTIQITNANEPPVVETLQLAVSELAGPLSIVGVIDASDPDSGQTLLYSITGGSGASDFVIDSTTGIVKVAAESQLDFELDDTKSLLITVSDNGTPPSETTVEVVIRIENENEPPEFRDQIGSVTVTVGNEIGLKFPDGFVVDPDGDAWIIEPTIDGNEFPSWLEYDAQQMRLSGIPTSRYVGSYDVSLKTFSPATPELFSSLTFEILVEISETPLRNSVLIQDVNGDRLVSALDALRIINFIARVGSEQTMVDQSTREDAFYDVTGDNVVTALDALRVINELARLGLEGEAEPVLSQNLGPLAVTVDDRLDRRDAALGEYMLENQLF